MKKTAKAPKVKVTITKKILGKAPEKYSFYLQDGRVLRSIYDLIDELETMTQDAFNQYVSDVENHFANWVNDVFEESELAEDMRRARTAIETQRTLLKHLVRELTKEMKKHKKHA
ncbi:hypothetical protein D6825_04000 [Candidatus Woesearchaeota archaeon]|nr:MAG: hypothetical protein D6825_04000 [Candidatus Woesearchaeota archaeon]